MRKTQKVKTMKKLLLLSAALVSSGLSLAQDVGRVISATPIVQQVGVPRQVCNAEQVTVQQPKSGAGAIMGAIAGAAIGHAVGGGAGTAAATMLGIIGGAAIGDNVEAAGAPQMQSVQRCATQTSFESRTVAYNVVYEFAGRQYAVQMPSDPGPTIQLQVAPAAAVAQAGVPVDNAVTYAPAMYGQTRNVIVVSPPVYSGYYVQPYYPLVGLGLGLGYWAGRHGRHRWH